MCGRRRRRQAAKFGTKAMTVDAMLASSHIGLVVNLTVPNAHFVVSHAALSAGKHVSSEKPLCVSVEEGRQLVDEAERRGAGSAARRTRSWAHAIGHGTPHRSPGPMALHVLEAMYAILDAAETGVGRRRTARRRHLSNEPDPARGGRTAAAGVGDRALDIGRWTPGGAVAHLACTMASAGIRHATIMGERGVIETSFANHAPPDDATLALRLRRGTAGSLPFETITMPAGNGFRAEAEAFARLVRGDEAGWNGASEAESIDTARSLEAILESLRGGGWVELDGEAA